jgi:hypothetical protein
VCFLIRLSESSPGSVCVSIKDPQDPIIQKKPNKMDHILIPITNQNYLRFSEHEDLQSMSQLIEVRFFDIYNLVVLNKRSMNDLFMNKQQRFCRKHKTEVKTSTKLQTEIEAKLHPNPGEHHYTVTQDRYRPFSVESSNRSNEFSILFFVQTTSLTCFLFHS